MLKVCGYTITQTERGNMGGFGGNLTDYGQTSSIEGKNIGALYRAPKEELDFKEELDDFETMSAQDLLDLIPTNWYEENDQDYWVDDYVHFWGKDGQTNAYVKRGIDNEIDEPLDRYQINKFAWLFATEDNHIYFKAGGKIRTNGRDWFIIKVINQQSTYTIQNKYNAMDTGPDNKRLLRFGLKTLVLV